MCTAVGVVGAVEVEALLLDGGLGRDALSGGIGQDRAEGGPVGEEGRPLQVEASGIGRNRATSERVADRAGPAAPGNGWRGGEQTCETGTTKGMPGYDAWRGMVGTVFTSLTGLSPIRLRWAPGIRNSDLFQIRLQSPRHLAIYAFSSLETQSGNQCPATPVFLASKTNDTTQ